jgi:hypothetical protein
MALTQVRIGHAFQHGILAERNAPKQAVRRRRMEERVRLSTRAAGRLSRGSDILAWGCI